MAGPSSFVPSPSPVSSPSTKRRFTLDEANRSLPLVSRIVRDIVATHNRVTHLQGQAQPTSNKKKAAADNDVKASPSQKELESAVDRLQGFVEELTEIGVELKDYQTGLIDFIGRHQGRDVYLCWKLGETSVNFWHELHTGFAGRQPVSSLEEKD